MLKHKPFFRIGRLVRRLCLFEVKCQIFISEICPTLGACYPLNFMLLWLLISLLAPYFKIVLQSKGLSWMKQCGPLVPFSWFICRYNYQVTIMWWLIGFYAWLSFCFAVGFFFRVLQLLIWIRQHSTIPFARLWLWIWVVTLISCGHFEGKESFAGIERFSKTSGTSKRSHWEEENCRVAFSNASFAASPGTGSYRTCSNIWIFRIKRQIFTFPPTCKQVVFPPIFELF